RRGDAPNSLLRHLRGCGRLEQIRPDDVAREQPVGLLGERARVGRRLAGGKLADRAREPLDTADAQLERLDQLLVLRAERARRVELLSLRDILALLLGDPGERAAE